MKKGICIGSIPGNLEEKFRIAKDAGYDGVEINTVNTDEESKNYKEMADRFGVEIHSVMNSAHWQFPLSDPDPEVRAKSVDGMTKSLKSAAIVGADAVLLVPGVVNEKVPYEEVYETSQKEVKKLAKLAEELKVIIAIENVWNKFLLSPMEFSRYIDEIESDYVAAYFDVGNILIYGYPDQWVRSLGPRLKKVHVKGFKVGPKAFSFLLDSDIDWAAVMKAFRDVGYDGYITAELPTYRSFPEQMAYDTSVHLSKIFGL